MKQRDSLVDIFKGIAIMMVVLVHSAQTFDLPKEVAYIPKLGQMGCQIFYLLSSFTLIYSFRGVNYSLQKE